jgi:hypothetical protein
MLEAALGEGSKTFKEVLQRKLFGRSYPLKQNRQIPPQLLHPNPEQFVCTLAT